MLNLYNEGEEYRHDKCKPRILSSIALSDETILNFLLNKTRVILQAMLIAQTIHSNRHPSIHSSIQTLVINS